MTTTLDNVPIPVAHFLPKEELSALRAEVRTLRRELYALAQRIAAIPEPARPGWSRTAPKIARVTLHLIGGRQYVISYDPQGREIEGYTGFFDDVGLRVLANSRGIRWSFEGNIADMETIRLQTI